MEMAITRLYSGEDGQSHIEEMDPSSHPDLASLMAAKGIIFSSAPAGHVIDWHNAPRRQFIITLSGEAEVELGDGSVYRFGPGDVNLAEDLTGKGHITRVVGDKPRLTAVVHLAG
jgi:hypothetical protein